MTRVFPSKKTEQKSISFRYVSGDAKDDNGTLWLKTRVSDSGYLPGTRGRGRGFYRVVASANFRLCFSVLAESFFLSLSLSLFFGTSLKTTSRFRKHAAQRASMDRKLEEKEARAREGERSRSFVKRLTKGSGRRWSRRRQHKDRRGQRGGEVGLRNEGKKRKTDLLEERRGAGRDFKAGHSKVEPDAKKSWRRRRGAFRRAGNGWNTYHLRCTVRFSQTRFPDSHYSRPPLPS